MCDRTAGNYLATSPDGLPLALKRSGRWCLLKSDDPRQSIVLESQGDLRKASISSDHRLVAIAGWNTPQTRVFDCRTGKLVADLQAGQYGTVHFSPDNRWLATSQEGVKLWRVKNWQLARELQAFGNNPMGLGVVFSPDSQVVAIGQPTGITRLIVPETGSDIAELTHPNQSCASHMVFSPDQSRLITLENDRAACGRIWDLVAIRRQLAQRGLDWHEGLLRVSSADSDAAERDAAEQPHLRVTLDDDHLFDKHQAAVLLYESGRVPDSTARKLIDQSLQLDPRNAVAHNKLAWLLATSSKELRDPRQSLDHARQAVALDNDNHTYCNTLGVALYRTGRYAESISMLNRSLGVGDGQEAAFDLVFLALCLARLGDWSLANDCYTRATTGFEAQANRLSSREKEDFAQFLNEAKAIGLPRRP